jgi:predicted PurR-regulated permease PerM
MERSAVGAKRALLVLLLGALVLVAMVFRPLAGAIFLAAVFAMVLWPLQSWLTRRLKGKKSIAASILVAMLVLLVLAPMVGLTAVIVNESIEAVQFVTRTFRSEGLQGLLAPLPDFIERPLTRLQLETGDLQERISQWSGRAAAAVGGALATTWAILFQTIMMVIALFVFLTNKEAVLQWIDDASPLRKGQTRELFQEFARVCKSVIISTALTALVQAVVALVGYFIARVPHPFFFFGLTFVIAFIPAVGAGSVCLLAAALQALSGHPWFGLFLAIYGVVVVGLSDNVIKPLLMKDGMSMHGAVVFFALLGGLAAFGAIGLLVGPLAVALFLAMLRIYQRDYASDPEDRRAMRERTARPD